MHFGPWHALAEAINNAPNTPGVIQTRAEAIFAYPKGQSAMVYYACSGPNQPLSEFMSQHGPELLARAEQQGACWIRFGEAPDPQRELSRLVKRFEERFGSRPIGNEAAVEAPGSSSDSA